MWNGKVGSERSVILMNWREWELGDKERYQIGKDGFFQGEIRSKIALSVSAKSLFLGLCLWLSFSLCFFVFSVVRRKLGKGGGYSTTMSGLPQYVAHLHNFLLLYNLLCCLWHVNYFLCRWQLISLSLSHNFHHTFTFTYMNHWIDSKSIQKKKKKVFFFSKKNLV